MTYNHFYICCLFLRETRKVHRSSLRQLRSVVFFLRSGTSSSICWTALWGSSTESPVHEHISIIFHHHAHMSAKLCLQVEKSHTAATRPAPLRDSQRHNAGEGNHIERQSPWLTALSKNQALNPDKPK